MATSGHAFPTATGGSVPVAGLAPAYGGGKVKTDRVLFHSDDPPLSFEARLTDLARPSSGLGGWDQVERRRRRSLTVYKGTNGWQIDIPLTFDKFRTKESVETDIRQLELMGGVNPGDDEPPKLIIDGGGAIPHDYTNSPSLRWVINNVEWGDYRVNKDNHRVRQLATVTLYQYIADDNIEDIKPASKHKKGHPKTYKIKKGDTLQKIASRFYHNPKKWKDIASKNHIRDPNHLKVGRVIKLP